MKNLFHFLVRLLPLPVLAFLFLAWLGPDKQPHVSHAGICFGLLFACLAVDLALRREVLPVKGRPHRKILPGSTEWKFALGGMVLVGLVTAFECAMRAEVGLGAGAVGVLGLVLPLLGGAALVPIMGARRRDS